MLNSDIQTEYDIKQQYPFLYEKIREEFPHLSEEDKVKIAQLVTGVCGTCRDAPSGCHCWNDD